MPSMPFLTTAARSHWRNKHRQSMSHSFVRYERTALFQAGEGKYVGRGISMA